LAARAALGFALEGDAVSGCEPGERLVRIEGEGPVLQPVPAVAAASPGEAAGEQAIPFFGRLNALENRLFDDAADRRLDGFPLLEAALIAGGVEDEETLRKYDARCAALADELRRSGVVAGSARHKAEVVFQFMHRQVLRGGYRVDCTDPRLAFDEGRFNCVSASVLYICLAEKFGLKVCGLEVPGHSMCRLFLPDGPLDLETTCPTWFELLDNPKRQAEALAQTVGTISPALRAKVREVSPVEIAAMIYYNRGVDYLGKNCFHEAAAANAKALKLDPASVTARGNLLATLNNWSIQLSGEGKHAEAVALLRQGLAFSPDYQAFALNYVHVHHEWVEDLCRNGRYEEALDLLSRAAEELPNRPYFRRAPLDVNRRWAEAVGKNAKPLEKQP
jgi:tetratricopeptide (TPR) repeat protein